MGKALAVQAWGVEMGYLVQYKSQMEQLEHNPVSTRGQEAEMGGMPGSSSQLAWCLQQ